jgi:ubiquinone biosynthesis protein UbiJ
MKLAQVQEKNEALNSEKLRLEGYLRTAKKVLALQAQWPSPWLQSHHYSLLLCTR